VLFRSQGTDFGVWKLATASTARTFSLQNLSLAAITPVISAIVPNSNNVTSPDFSIVPSTCGAAVAPGASCNFDVIFNTTTDGVKSATIIASGGAAVPSAQTTVTGTGDGTAPTLVLDPVITFTKLATQIISGTVTDTIGVASVDVTVAGVSQGAATITAGNPSIWTKTITLPNANAGNSISVTATDTAQPGGNISAAQTATITNDTINPVVSITAPANGSLINTRNPALTFNVVETNPAFNTVTVDNAPVNPVPATLATLADGQHTVRVDAGDSAGNPGTASTTFTVDATPPVITVSSPTPINQRIGTTNPVLTFSIIDANPDATKTVVTLDGTPVVNPVSGTTTLGPFTAGSAHTLTIDATDILGNVSPVNSVTFTVVLADGSVISLGATPPTISDALIVLRHAVSLTTLVGDQFAHADVAPLDANGVPNPNNSVDIADALVILRKVVGLVTSF